MQRDYGEQLPPDYFEIVSSVQASTEAVNYHSATVIAGEAAGSCDATAERAGSHDETPVE